MEVPNYKNEDHGCRSQAQYPDQAIISCFPPSRRFSASFCPPLHTAPLMDSIASLSDLEILNLFREGRRLSEIDHPFAEGQVILITDDTVAKVSQDVDEEVTYPSEAFALDVVSQHTTIPVPRVRRVVKRRHGDYLIVMDLIPGKQLSTLWPAMTSTERAIMVEKLQDYVQQLRKVSIPQRQIPGPLDRDLNPRTCESPPVFGQVVSSRGPFASYADLEAFFTDRRQKMMSYAGVDIAPFNAAYPLVLTHQDLNPRNIIVGGDGTLSIVDWTWAGFYPEWWESVAMKAQAENEVEVQGSRDPSWDAIIPQVCGEYKDMEDWLASVGQSFSWS